VLRGSTDSTTWATVNSVWPLEINLTNNNAVFGATVTATGDHRAPIFYDSANTGYYLDANSTSRLDYLRPNSISIVGSQDNGAPTWDFRAYVVQSQHWYGQTSTQTMYMGQSNAVNVPGDIRVPIFYDYNNTGYYTDPASTSNLNVLAVQRAYAGYDAGETNSFSCSNWFRSNGSTGWYNASYVGGWFMQDTSWIRSYGSKNIYCDAFIRAQGSFRVGSEYSVWGVYGTYSAYLTAMAYISFDWNGGYNSYSNHGIASTDLNGSFTDSMSVNSFNDIVLRVDSNANNSASYVRFMNDTTQSNQFAYIGYNGSSYEAYFSGTLYSTGEVYAYYSDRRLKTDINTIDSALDKLRKIRGVYYKTNELFASLQTGTEVNLEKRHLGVLAQDVQEVFPEVIELAPFDRNQDGTSKSGENYLTVKYDRLIPVLIQAIKEQQEKIEQLEYIIKEK